MDLNKLATRESKTPSDKGSLSIDKDNIATLRFKVDTATAKITKSGTEYYVYVQTPREDAVLDKTKCRVRFGGNIFISASA